ncbi:MAG: acyltransferase [Treponema sp.]|nr:acyltransferase [Treponema sp.]
MRKNYLDNIRWMTVVVVVLYHVLYMYNAEGIVGVVGKITNLEVQYYDLFQYIVYPWIMMLLFMVSGISSRLYLEKHSHKEFIASRTRKLLVPCTIGLFAFQFLQGYVNASIGGAFANNPDVPLLIKIMICILSGIGVLWYIQLLWIFSLMLVLVRKLDKDRLWNICGKAGLPVLVALLPVVYAAGQVLNTPIIVVYRFGLYFFVFLFGYFVLSHDEVIERLKKYFFLFLVATIGLCIAFCIRYFGENYAISPAYRSVLFLCYGYTASLAIIAGMAKYYDVSNGFTQWMSKRSYGLYVFHYLGISAVGLFIGKKGLLPPAAVYALSLVAGFAGGYLLNEIISRIPGYRWAVLGIRESKRS